MSITYIADNKAVGLKTLPDGKVSAWGTRRVYERQWAADIVAEVEKVGLGSFYRRDGRNFRVVETLFFTGKRALTEWAKKHNARDLDAEGAKS